MFWLLITAIVGVGIGYFIANVYAGKAGTSQALALPKPKEESNKPVEKSTPPAAKGVEKPKVELKEKPPPKPRVAPAPQPRPTPVPTTRPTPDPVQRKPASPKPAKSSSSKNYECEKLRARINRFCFKSRSGKQQALRFVEELCRSRTPEHLTGATLRALADLKKLDFSAYFNFLLDDVRRIRDNVLRLLPEYLDNKRRGRPVTGIVNQAKRIIQNALAKYPPEIFYGLKPVYKTNNPEVLKQDEEMLSLLVSWLNTFSGFRYTKDDVLARDWKATRKWTVPLKKWAEERYKKLPCIGG